MQKTIKSFYGLIDFGIELGMGFSYMCDKATNNWKEKLLMNYELQFSNF